LQPSSISIEDYVGAIYRLQTADSDLLPLSELQDFFGFSPISIHEMVQKLSQRGLVEYQPYRGVKLTARGTKTAEALVRRHRIWECFLANELHIPLDEVHQLAGNLEHVTPDWISERLFKYINEPDFCPHGSKISGLTSDPIEIQLEKARDGQYFHITRISPEKKTVLTLADKYDLRPGKKIQVLQNNEAGIVMKMVDREVQFSGEALTCIWGVEISNES